VPSVTIAFSYNPDKNPLLHEWLSSISHNRSNRIREMLEQSIRGDSTALLEQILHEVQAIRSEGFHMEPIPAVLSSRGSIIPDDIRANLQALGE